MKRDTVGKDFILKFSPVKGFGKFFWNLCLSCGGVSIRTTVWEDATVEHGDCLICSRMAEIMELEDLAERKPRST